MQIEAHQHVFCQDSICEVGPHEIFLTVNPWNNTSKKREEKSQSIITKQRNVSPYKQKYSKDEHQI